MSGPRPSSPFRSLRGAVLSVFAAAWATSGLAVEVPPPPLRPDPTAWIDAESWETMSLEEQRAWLDVQHERIPSLTIAHYLQLEEREDEVCDREYERMAAEHEAAETRPSADADGVQSTDILLPPPPPPASRPADERELQPESLEPTLQRQLEQHGVAFGASVRQSFVPYLAGPVFITSDSVLNAFHVLFEDSFRALEYRRAERIPDMLHRIVSAARTAPAVVHRDFVEPIMSEARHAAALEHLERVLGPALVIDGMPLTDFSETVRDDIRRDVARIEAATSVELPKWLGEPTSEFLAIDFTRLRPVGFYTESPRLQRWFKMVRWLQIVPFRAAREHEFDALVLFGLVAEDLSLLRALHGDDSLLGRPDDPHALHLMRAIDTSYPRMPHLFDSKRTHVRTKVAGQFVRSGFYRIDSDLRLSRTLPEAFSDLVFRLLPPSGFADAFLFQRALDHDVQPDGLTLAAWLGSPLARQTLDDDESELVRAFDSRRTSKHNDLPDTGTPVYEEYLEVLRALFVPPEEGAPVFMRSDAWKAKSCQTALSGWAQMRHAYSLQAKQSAFLLGTIKNLLGFVEASPEFFSGLARLVERCTDAFESEDCFEPSASIETARITEFLSVLHRLGPEGPLHPRELTPEQYDLMEAANSYARTHDNAVRGINIWRSSEFESDRAEIVGSLEKRKSALESGALAPSIGPPALRQRWLELSRAASRLEALAHKTLRGAAWTPDEARFLKTYGESMAFVMGYFGNSWLEPRDDAPRWAEVFAFPERRTSLAAAVGRPREIFVLHPWKDTHVLCRGSVMQYYEYESPKRLTDHEWRALLDSPAAPAVPAWLAPYAAPPPHTPDRGP
ncbi:DUF3160 domain-containing protein [Congregicoccus parvus]|uniref:DUF3160 domain-containing protein n=1 Tax=Congregicoccus parvus TaxID=3081749 RepID=UPI003FA52823